jgi:Family of unknown function (DUF6498)
MDCRYLTRVIAGVIALVLSLLKNAVPALGVFLRDWAAPGALLLYLGENVVLAFLGALTVRLAGPRGETGKSLQTFFLIAAPFTFSAAVFTAAVILIRDEYTFAPRELAAGFASMVVIQLIAFALNLRAARGITIAECESLLVGILGRIFLLALAVWIGLALAFFVSTAFVIPFMILKTIVDLGSLRPSQLRRRAMLI